MAEVPWFKEVQVDTAPYVADLRMYDFKCSSESSGREYDFEPKHPKKFLNHWDTIACQSDWLPLTNQKLAGSGLKSKWSPTEAETFILNYFWLNTFITII